MSTDHQTTPSVPAQGRRRTGAAALATVSAVVGLLSATLMTVPASAAPRAASAVLLAAPSMPPQDYNGEVRGIVGSWGGYGNGEIPTSVLCSPSWTSTKHKARCDAAAALEEMNVAYRARFGVNMSVTSTYRTYEQQVALKIAKPTLAAKPGTSNHGWGLAIDFGGGVQTFGSAQHNWMRANANRFGWFHPKWAQYYGSLPEPWHWEYAGAVASGRAEHSKALGAELVRTQSWSSPAQWQCLATLWQVRSGWDYTKSKDDGDLRGIPQASMSKTFGTSWAGSSAATTYLQSPQRQIEWGLRDLTERHGTACDALAYYGPTLTATVTGPSTVPAGGTSAVSVTYAKDRQPVETAELTLQVLRSGAWVDAAEVTVVDGVATHRLAPGAATTTYRLRNWDASATSPAFTIAVAEVVATVTGPATVAPGRETPVTVRYTKDDKPVPAATLTLQELRAGAWVDTATVDVSDGVATRPVKPTTTTTYRVRNWNGTATSSSFTVAVAEVTASITGPASVAANAGTSFSVRYTKDGEPVPTATLTLQELRDGVWVDTTPLDVSQGTASRTVKPGMATTSYRVRNWNGTAVSAPFIVTVVTRFVDVAPDNPLAPAVNWADLNKIITGYDDDTFRPLAPVTRQAMAAFLYRQAGSPQHDAPAVSPFADVAPSDPFYGAITWLAAEGIAEGSQRADGGRVFKPAAAVSREAMAAFLYRSQGSPTFTAPKASAFADVSTGSRFYAEIAWLAERGIATGTTRSDGAVTYAPADPVSRQAMASFLQRVTTAGS